MTATTFSRMTDSKIPVVLYGGAFDPPTLAHERAVWALSKISHRVVIVPSGPRYDKKYKADESARFEMLRIFESRFSWSNVELDTDFLSGELGETTTLGMDEHYRAKFGIRPHQAFWSDTVPTMSEWDPTLEVLERLPKVIFVRPGYDADLSIARNFVLAEMDDCEEIRRLSSTAVRSELASGRIPQGLAPEILRHVFEFWLYGSRAFAD